MTKQEWLASGYQPRRRLLAMLMSTAGERRMHLFGVACCERIWRVVHPERQSEARNALLTIERYADGQATDKELNDAAWAAEFVTFGDTGTPFFHAACSGDDFPPVADHAIDELFHWERRRLKDPQSSQYELSDERQAELDSIIATEEAIQYDLLSDITGNVSGAAKLPASWRTPTVVALATGIYVGKAFDRMPILADALEEAGCDNADILNHCRGSGPHVRGCWVVDLLLGKS